MSSFILVIALVALVSLPSILDLYLSDSRGIDREEEYIPDGR